MRTPLQHEISYSACHILQELKIATNTPGLQTLVYAL